MIIFLIAWHFAIINFVSGDRDVHGDNLLLPMNNEKKGKDGGENTIEEQSNHHLAEKHARKIAVQNDGRRTTRSRSLSSSTWVPYGEDINAGISFGASTISLSGRGDRIAIGVPADTPFVKVFEYSNSTASSWIQLGNDFLGKEYTRLIPSLSSNGNFLAIGVPRDSNIYGDEAGIVGVFRKHSNNNDWVQMGLDIYGDSSWADFGQSLSLSDNGKLLAIGSPGRNLVKIFKFANGAWVQTGSTINGGTQDDFVHEFGISVSLSGGGKTVAVGSNFYNTVGSNDDHVSIFRQMANSKWKQIGESIKGGEFFYSPTVSLSNDGNTVAVGSPAGNRNNFRGIVRVFRFVKGDWEMLGETFKGKKYDGLGVFVSLSDNGNVLAMLHQVPDQGPCVSVYHFVFGEWNQIGEDLCPDGFSWMFYPSLSADGTILAYSEDSSVRVSRLDSNISFGCKDSPLTFKATDNNSQNIRKTCDWVWEASAMSRCSITGVPETCPATCNECSSCQDSPLKVKYRSGKKAKPKWRYCTWVAKKKTQRCTIKGIAETCKLTCGTCSP